MLDICPGNCCGCCIGCCPPACTISCGDTPCPAPFTNGMSPGLLTGCIEYLLPSAFAAASFICIGSTFVCQYLNVSRFTNVLCGSGSPSAFSIQSNCVQAPWATYSNPACIAVVRSTALILSIVTSTLSPSQSFGRILISDLPSFG